jgi:hypothetical protein
MIAGEHVGRRRWAILAGCPPDGVVLDCFAGASTTGLVALRHGRRYIGIELNPSYVEMSRRRIVEDCPLFNAAPDGAAGGTGEED